MFFTKIFVLVLCVTLALTQNDCQTSRLNAVKNLQTVVQGTNVGSWFAVESWMVPDLFNSNGCSTGNDGQYMLEQCLGGRAQEVLNNHWNTFITEDDFAMMSQRGVNLVRVPLGWWQIYDPQGGAANANLNYNIVPRDYQTGALQYVDRIFEWGNRYGIAVLVDMHAAPGSQNGQAHSSPAAPGEKDWDLYPDNVGQTIDSIELYAERYANDPALFGFALLNEPDHIDLGVLQDYYQRAYEAVRRHSDAWIVINPMINPFESGTEGYWTGFMNPDAGFTRVAMDLHYYSCFGGGGDQTSADGNIGFINYDRLNGIHDYMNVNPKPILVGEWSGCWHATEGNSRVGEFIQAQVNVYNQANMGWTFWSWAPGTGGNTWSLKSAFNEGWLGNLNQPC